MDYVIGIDIGTQSTKALLVDVCGAPASVFISIFIRC